MKKWIELSGWETFDFLKPHIPERHHNKVIASLLFLSFGGSALLTTLARWLWHLPRVKAGTLYLLLFPVPLMWSLTAIAILFVGFPLLRKRIVATRKIPVTMSSEFHTQFGMIWIVETQKTGEMFELETKGPICPAANCSSPLGFKAGNFIWICPNENCLMIYDGRVSELEMKRQVRAGFIGRMIQKGIKSQNLPTF